MGKKFNFRKILIPFVFILMAGALTFHYQNCGSPQFADSDKLGSNSAFDVGLSPSSTSAVTSVATVFTAAPTGNKGVVNYVWGVNGGGANASACNSSSCSLTFTTVGNYSVSLTATDSGSGSVAAKTASVAVTTTGGGSGLNVTINPSTVSVNTNAATAFNAIVSGNAGAVTYTWTASGGGANANACNTSNCSLTFTSAGNYSVTVSATNNGTTKTATSNVTVTTSGGGGGTCVILTGCFGGHDTFNIAGGQLTHVHNSGPQIGTAGCAQYAVPAGGFFADGVQKAPGASVPFAGSQFSTLISYDSADLIVNSMSSFTIGAPGGVATPDKVKVCY